jgi:hypothetical protein
MAYTLPDRIGGFNNNGTFERVCNWVADKNAGIEILAESMDTECDNFAEGFNNCITRDLKGKPTTDFDFNNYSAYNLDGDLSDKTSAVNAEMLVKDPTRLFYDTSIESDTIELNNGYINTIAKNNVDGYHFFVLVSNTITVSSEYLTMMIKNDGNIFSNRAVKGGDGLWIPANSIQRNTLYECVLLTDVDGVKSIYFLDVGGGGGGGGGRVDRIVAWDDTMLIDTNAFTPGIKVNPAKVVKTLNSKTPDAAGDIKTIETIAGLEPDDEGDLALTLNSHEPDETGDWKAVQQINGKDPNTDGNFGPVIQTLNGVYPTASTGDFPHVGLIRPYANDDDVESFDLRWDNISLFFDTLAERICLKPIYINVLPRGAITSDTANITIDPWFSGSLIFDFSEIYVLEQIYVSLSIRRVSNCTIKFINCPVWHTSIDAGVSGTTIIFQKAWARPMNATAPESFYKDTGVKNTVIFDNTSVLNNIEMMQQSASLFSVEHGGEAIINVSAANMPSAEYLYPAAKIATATEGASIKFLNSFRGSGSLTNKFVKDNNSEIIVNGVIQ